MGRTKRQRLRNKHESKEINSKLDDSIINIYKYLQSFGWKNETMLACKHFPKTGRGLYSKIATGNDIIIRLPFDSLITICTLEEDIGFKRIFESCELKMQQQEITFQSLLAIFILYHKHIENSPFKRYIDTIPKTFTNPNFCNRNEYYQFPTNLLEETAEQKKNIRLYYNYYQKALINSKCSCCNEPVVETFLTQTNFEWSFFAVNSRSVFIDPKQIYDSYPNRFFKKYLKDSPQLGLAPFLDLFNHSDKASTNVTVTSTNNKLSKTKSQKDYALHLSTNYNPYEQIFISYGHLTNFKLLLEYGFCLEENIHDRFDITLNDIEELIKSSKHLSENNLVHRNKFKYIRDHNLNDQMFVNLETGISHNLQVVLYLIFHEPSHFTNVLHYAAFGSADFSQTNENTKLLLLFKLKEYENLKNNLEANSTLSDSGNVLLHYITYCISYIDQCINKFL